jgi:preprotein translocase subunit SecF
MMKFNFNFVGRRLIWYIIALAIIIPGIISLFVQGLNLGIDFTGGSIFQVNFENSVQLADVRAVVDKHVGSATIQESENNRFVIRTFEISTDVVKEIVDDLSATLGTAELGGDTEDVSPVIGRELLSNARWALIIAGIFMLIYIAFRFQFDFAVTSILALLHDSIVTVGIFSIFQIPINGAFIAAILTVIGYSINNTIVVFDRVRENQRIMRNVDMPELLNASINQTVTRSVNTVLAIMFLLVSLYFLGGATTKTFILALIVGNIAGFYSSLFLVCSILSDFYKKFGANFGQGKSGKGRSKAKPRTTKPALTKR